MENNPTHENIIINRPNKLPNARKGIELTFLTLGCGLWFIFFRPVFAFLLWIVGFKFFYKYILSEGGIAGLQENAMLFSFIILFILAVIRSWNLYNKQRFTKRSKRKRVRCADCSDIDRFFRLKAKTTGIIQKAKILNIHFYRDNNIEIKDESIEFCAQSKFIPS